MPSTFKVSEVAIEREALPQISVAEALGLRGLGEMEAHKATSTSVVAGPQLHGLLLATHLAFAHHLPLVIAPDDVWACILQGFALHVATESETLRARLVRHEGKQELRVVRHGFVRGAENDWAGVVHELVDKMQEHLLVGTRGLVGGFSTTGPIEAAGSRVALLSAMQSFFSYVVETRCGIPEITLLGSVADWKALRLRAELLREFDLDWWITPLLPALDELVRASEGQADAARWRSFYKHESTSGDEYVSGWILLFMPYIRHENGGFTLRNPYLTGPSREAPEPPLPSKPGAKVEVWGPSRKVEEGFYEELSVSELPPGTSAAPFVWDYLNDHLAMDLGAGLIGATQDPESGAVRAVHGWWVSTRASEILVVEERDARSVRVKPRWPARLRSIAGLCSHAPRGRRVELWLEGCSLLETLESPDRWATAQQLVLRDAPLLRSLDGLAQLSRVEELVVEDAPLLQDVGSIRLIYFLKRVEFTRCSSLTDLRSLLLLKKPEIIVISDCKGLPEALHGRFEGEGIARFRALLHEHQGRPRHRIEKHPESPTLAPVLKGPSGSRSAAQKPGSSAEGPARTHAIWTLLCCFNEPYATLIRGKKEHEGYQFHRAVTLRVGGDSLLLAGAAWPALDPRREGPTGSGVTTERPPFWVVEVLARPEEHASWAAKLALLAQAGVRHAWQLDLAAETLTALQHDGASWSTIRVWSGDTLVRAEPFEAAEFALFDLWCDPV